MKLVNPFSAHNSAQKKLHKMLFTNQALRWSLLPMPIHYYGVQSMRVCVRTSSDAVPFTIRFLPVFSFRGHSLGFICERFESSIFSAQVGRQNCLWGLKLMTSMWYKGHGSTRADMGGGWGERPLNTLKPVLSGHPVLKRTRSYNYCDTSRSLMPRVDFHLIPKYKIRSTVIISSYSLVWSFLKCRGVPCTITVHLVNSTIVLVPFAITINSNVCISDLDSYSTEQLYKPTFEGTKKFLLLLLLLLSLLLSFIHIIIIIIIYFLDFFCCCCNHLS